MVDKVYGRWMPTNSFKKPLYLALNNSKDTFLLQKSL